LIFSLFTTSIIGCQESGSTLDHPSPPRHSLDIEGEVKMQAEVSWVNSTNELETKIWAVNLDSDNATIETGPCAFNVLAYTSWGEDKELVWYNKMPENYICFDELLRYTIPPKDTIQIEKQQQYISGDHWHWNVPHGNLKFVLEAYTKEEKSIKFDANAVTIN